MINEKIEITDENTNKVISSCEYEIKTDEYGEYALVYDLKTDVEYRRKGFARKCLIRAKNDIRKHGFKGYIFISVDEDHEFRDSLREFYDSLGFCLCSMY